MASHHPSDPNLHPQKSRTFPTRLRPRRINTEVPTASTMASAPLQVINPNHDPFGVVSDYSRRPQVYLHFEFGVSYTPKRPPNKHSLTFSSKNWREQDNFPRHVPLPTTNYLTTGQGPIPPQQQPRQQAQQPSVVQSQQPQPRQHRPAAQSHQPRPFTSHHAPQSHYNVPRDTAQPTVYHSTRPGPSSRGPVPKNEQPTRTYQALQPSPSHLDPQAQPQQRRQSRSEQRSSEGSLGHSRGSSAPPPWNTSPWDAEPEPMGSSALPTRPRHNADVMKDLPSAPSSSKALRLDESYGAGRLWSSSSWPEEYGMPDDPTPPGATDRAGSFSTGKRPALLDVAAPLVRRHTEDPARTKELEELSSAMMTIDNGFESQWWYQGTREPMALQRESGDLVSPPLRSVSQPPLLPDASALATPIRKRSIGWAIAQPSMSALSDDGESHDPRAKGGYNMVTVSPITEMSSPQSVFQGDGRLQRSLTTRSDELFIPS